MQTLTAVANYLIYLALSGVMLVFFFVVYTRCTPFDEVLLIRQGNTAAAFSLGGALLGFSLTVASASFIRRTIAVLWLGQCGAMVVQLLAYRGDHALHGNLERTYRVQQRRLRRAARAISLSHRRDQRRLHFLNSYRGGPSWDWFDFVKKQFIDVLQWNEETEGVLAWRYPMQDFEIQNGAILTVRESQIAVFVNEGTIADVFGPGTHKLTTQTLPVLTNLKNWDKLFESPFKSDVYFFSTRVQTGRKWGTPQPITIRDKDFDMIRLRAFGMFSYRVADPRQLLHRAGGTREVYTRDDVEAQLQGMMLSTMATSLGASNIPFLDMAANQALMAEQVKGSLATAFDTLWPGPGRIQCRLRQPAGRIAGSARRAHRRRHEGRAVRRQDGAASPVSRSPQRFRWRRRTKAASPAWAPAWAPAGDGPGDGAEPGRGAVRQQPPPHMPLRRRTSAGIASRLEKLKGLARTKA